MKTDSEDSGHTRIEQAISSLILRHQVDSQWLKENVISLYTKNVAIVDHAERSLSGTKDLKDIELARASGDAHDDDVCEVKKGGIISTKNNTSNSAYKDAAESFNKEITRFGRETLSLPDEEKSAAAASSRPSAVAAAAQKSISIHHGLKRKRLCPPAGSSKHPTSTENDSKKLRKNAAEDFQQWSKNPLSIDPRLRR